MENKLSIKERNEQLQKFINLAEAQRSMYKGCPSDIGLTLESVIAAGIDMEIITWLSVNKYIAVHPNKPIWIAYDYNKYHSKSTLANLQYFLNKNKK
jgi:hypothetical protein